MSITRQDVDTILTRRIGAYLEEASMTASGSVNPYLTDPIRWALYMLGVSTASYTAVTDADLGNVAGTAVDALLDLSELRALESVLTNYTNVTTKVGQVEESRSDLGARIRTAIEDKRKRVAAIYDGLLAHPLDGAASSSVRVVSL